MNQKGTSVKEVKKASTVKKVNYSLLDFWPMPNGVTNTEKVLKSGYWLVAMDFGVLKYAFD